LSLFTGCGMFGVDIYPTDLGYESRQVRFPKSRRRRIRKKWRKDPRNWRAFPVRACYRMGDRFVCDFATYADIRARLVSP